MLWDQISLYHHYGYEQMPYTPKYSRSEITEVNTSEQNEDKIFIRVLEAMTV